MTPTGTLARPLPTARPVLRTPTPITWRDLPPQPPLGREPVETNLVMSAQDVGIYNCDPDEYALLAVDVPHGGNLTTGSKVTVATLARDGA